jgi:GNAT superfamily N-acetyltransferase
VTSDVAIRRAREAETGVVADHFRRMWLDIGWRPDALREDWADVVAAFVERARAEGDFAAFVAESDGEIVGTAACQVFSGLYPEIRLRASHLAGYVWGVYVRPSHRRLGLATRLTQAALDHLDAVGCTSVRLHASRDGAPVYRAMGFRETNELELAPSRPGRARGSR